MAKAKADVTNETPQQTDQASVTDDATVTAEAPAAQPQEAAPEPLAPSAYPMVKIIAFKLDTSRGMALEDQEIEIPRAEAEAAVARGDAAWL
jgi:hypothetical protein